MTNSIKTLHQEPVTDAMTQPNDPHPHPHPPTSNEAQIPAYKTAFLKTCLDNSILKFGTFTLKSGRQSPYFFNAGLFHHASLLRSISSAFAECIASHTPALDIDVLFGPAYKGIPLATATVEKLADLDLERFGDVSYSFNRKEAKDHGEGGMIVGAALKGKRILIVDDVVTAGTAKREAIEIIRREGGILAGIVVALDRKEKMPAEGADDGDGQPGPSAIGQIRKEYGVPVLSILTLDDLIEGAQQLGREDDAKKMDAYREKYKASD
ncbi:orotate phosphoribosyltransferase [Bachmanniomyces sp. S44760]|nr:orotate phosphoribosyltransferase [Bachmanniomyces sp. S44760]